jgi:anti-sigma B factor antagonist
MNATEITVTLEHDRALVALRGEHEAYSSGKLARQLGALLDEGTSVAVDLRQTTFVDSTVVGALLAAKRHADELSLGFVLIMGETTGWPVRRLLEITGLGSTFSLIEQ